MYQLRVYEKKGRALADAGITLEMMKDPGFFLGESEGGEWE